MGNKEYTIAGYRRAIQEHGVSIGRNAVTAAIKRGELRVIRRNNGRGGTSKRIVSDPLRDLVCPDTWLGKTRSIFSASHYKRCFKNRQRLEFGDVYRFIFALTTYAHDPISPGPQILPLDMRDNREQVLNRAARGIYKMQVTPSEWHTPIDTEEALGAAVQWVLSLPHERPRADAWRKKGIRELLRCLQTCTHRQREMYLRMLKAFKPLGATVTFSKTALCKRMHISLYQLAYHLRTNELMRACYKILTPKAPAQMSMRQATAQDLHWRNARQQSPTPKPGTVPQNTRLEELVRSWDRVCSQRPKPKPEKIKPLKELLSAWRQIQDLS